MSSKKAAAAAAAASAPPAGEMVNLKVAHSLWSQGYSVPKGTSIGELRQLIAEKPGSLGAKKDYTNYNIFSARQEGKKYSKVNESDLPLDDLHKLVVPDTVYMMYVKGKEGKVKRVSGPPIFLVSMDKGADKPVKIWRTGTSVGFKFKTELEADKFAKDEAMKFYNMSPAAIAQMTELAKQMADLKKQMSEIATGTDPTSASAASAPAVLAAAAANDEEEEEEDDDGLMDLADEEEG